MTDKPTVSRQERIFDQLESYLFGSRWLLFPINAGLILALVVYVMKFLVDLYHMVVSSFTSTTETFMVLVLGLIDTALIANLLVMIVQGSHQIFIRRLTVDANSRPQWLDHIDSGLLKLKVSLSIAGITLVQILKDFVDVERTDWTAVQHRLVIHMVALVSALAMAVIWRLTHIEKQNGHEERQHKTEAEHLFKPGDDVKFKYEMGGLKTKMGIVKTIQNNSFRRTLTAKMDDGSELTRPISDWERDSDKLESHK